MSVLSYGKQCIEQDDIDEVVKILKSDWISQGPKILEFEEAIATYCGAKYAVAVSSGTAALHIAVLTSGLSRGDEAITTPISFLATANAILYAGATPVFADIDYDTVNIDPEEIRRKITTKTKVILPVHFAGLPAEMEEIFKIARKKSLIVIEDGCHALGAGYQGRKIGSCQYSDMTVFSFHPVKHITTGEGGCITTNNKKYYERLLMLRNHGNYRSEALKKRYGGWFVEMRALGFNYRITDFQCALGLMQLKKLNRFLERRRQIAQRYHEAFSELEDSVKLPQLNFPDRKHAWHLYLFRLNLKKSGVNRRQLFDELSNLGINSQVHYIPIPQQPYYRRLLGAKTVRIPNAQRYYSEVLSLPLYPALSDDNIDYVVRTVKGVFKTTEGSW